MRDAPTLHMHAFVPRSRANGPGQRAVIWTSGCTLNCPGCFNPATHPAGGTPVAVDALAAQIAQIAGIEGVAISGGEPFQQPLAMLALLQRLRETTALSTLVFTGFTWAELLRMPFASRLPALIDVLISGRYDATRRIATGLRGSTNKAIVHLTDRYTPADLAAVPTGEIRIRRDGTIVATGIDPLRQG